MPGSLRKDKLRDSGFNRSSKRIDMSRAIRKSVGIIGLGIIGRRVADHLRRQGLSVFVWNRTPRPVPNFVGSPRELAQICNYLQIFVSDDDRVKVGDFGTAAAWTSGGPVFVALGGGARYALSPRAVFSAGIKLSGAIGPTGLLPTMAPEIALQCGF